MPFSHAISHPFIVYFTKILSIHEPCQARHPGNIEDHPPPARSVHHDQRLRATRSYEVGTFSMTSLLLQAWALWRPFRTLKLLWLNCSWCCRPAEHAMTPKKLLLVGAHHVKAVLYSGLYCRSCRCVFGQILPCRSLKSTRSQVRPQRHSENSLKPKLLYGHLGFRRSHDLNSS